MLVQRPLSSTAATPGVFAPIPQTVIATAATTNTVTGSVSLESDGSYSQTVEATAAVAVENGPEAVVSLDQLGPRTMTVTAKDATDSCANAHIGAVYPPDLESITFRGPIDINAIGSLEEVPILVAAPVGPTSEVVNVTERIGQGAIWNAFAVKSPESLESHVLKVSCVTAYQDQVDGDWEVAEIRKHIVQDILAHRLLDETPCVPRLLSVWAGVDNEGREYWATVEEDAGRPVDVEDMSDEQKQAVLDAYESIHKHGVMHADVKTVHWGFTGESDNLEARLIDFSHAVDLNALSAERRRMMCLSEMGDVRDALEAGCKGWTRDPYSLHPSPETSPAPADNPSAPPVPPVRST